MRIVALLLVLSVTGPAMVTAICELTCAHAAHHESQAASAGCHEQQPNPGTTALTKVIDGECHRDGELPTVVTTVLEKKLSPATGLTLTFVALARSGRPMFPVSFSVSPPHHAPSTTTPLRI